MRECPPQKNILYLEINYAEQNGYLEILIGCVWRNDGRGGGGLLPSNHFRLLKRALAIPICNRMSPFRTFYNNSFDTKCPGMEKKKQKTTQCPHRSLLKRRYRAAYDTDLW